MFNSKQKPPSAPEPTPERQPRVTHTPGAYPPLSPRPDPRAPDSRTQAAAPTAAQVAQLLSDAPKKKPQRQPCPLSRQSQTLPVNPRAALLLGPKSSSKAQKSSTATPDRLLGSRRSDDG